MRCRLILISNFDYPHCTDLAESGAAGVLEEDARRVLPPGFFHGRFESGSVASMPPLLNLKLHDMKRLDRTLDEAFTAATGSEEEPFMQDGDLIVIWVAGYGMSFPGQGGAVLLPTDVGSGEAPRDTALADACEIRSKILGPVQRRSRTGVTHLVLNLFRLPQDWSPVLDLSCITDTNVHVLACFAGSPKLLLRTGGNDSPAEERVTSSLCHHYSAALLAGDTTLEDVCRRTIAGVARDTNRQLVPKLLQSLAEPSTAAAAADRVAAFVWGGSSAAPAAAVTPNGHERPAQEGFRPCGGSAPVLPAVATPFDGWTLLRCCRGPLKMRVAEIRMEGQRSLRRDDALREALLHFTEKMGFIALAMGPDSVEIYHSRLMPALENESTERSDWDLYVRQPGLQYRLWPAAGQMASAGWAASDVRSGKAVQVTMTPAATLTFSEDPIRSGFLDFEGNNLLVAALLRRLCDAKSFVAASARVEVPEPEEQNPPEKRRKSSGVCSGYTLGELDASKCWYTGRTAVGEWLFMDLGEAELVRGLVVQGWPGYCYPTCHVTEVKVECGDDEDKLHPVMNSSGCIAQMTPTGQTSKNDAKLLVDFPEGPVVARYVKVLPTKWDHSSSYPYLRVGVRVEKARRSVVRLYRGATRQQVLDRGVEDAASTLYLR